MKEKTFEFIIQAGLLILLASCFYLYSNGSFFGICSKPITYKIGDLDTRFNLSRAEAIDYLKQAGNLWNMGTGHNLLEYSDDGKVVIDFVYDERQRTIIQNKILKEKVRNQENNLNEKSKDISVQKNNFLSLKNTYEQEVLTYNNRLKIYNNRVLEINNAGGATPEQASELNSEKDYLQSKGRELDQTKNNLNNYVKTLNQDVKEYNQITNSVNQIIDQINVNSGTEFEEGYYQNNKIVLYEYENIIDLKRLVAHELGHALGFGHTSDQNSIMHYLNTGEDFILTAQDIDQYKKVCDVN